MPICTFMQIVEWFKHFINTWSLEALFSIKIAPKCIWRPVTGLLREEKGRKDREGRGTKSERRNGEEGRKREERGVLFVRPRF